MPANPRAANSTPVMSRWWSASISVGEHVIKDALPAARLVELDGPHFLLQARPTESAAQVAEFAKAVGLAP